MTVAPHPATAARLRSGSDDRRPMAYTASGRCVPLTGTDPGDIDLRDVAGHLARLCRFAGATPTYYSVAQHSVLVGDLLAGHGPVVQLYGLLHDAHEAYFGDITTPARRMISAAAWGIADPALDRLADLTLDLDAAIHARAGLAWPPPAATRNIVAAADKKALATEVRDVLSDPRDPRAASAFGCDRPAPMRGAIKPWPWIKAEERFLEKFDELAILAGLPTVGGAA